MTSALTGAHASCLPELEVHDTTECMFRNMMIFEHLNSNVGHDVTSYLCFMSEIIRSAADVSLLGSRGIIRNGPGSDKEAARVFNKITEAMTIDPGSGLNKIRHHVDDICQNRWRVKRNKWWNNLMDTYFRSPWAALSLAGALLVIVLTILQTVFSYLQIRQH